MKKRIFLCLFLAFALACFVPFAACDQQAEDKGEGQGGEQGTEQGGEQGTEQGGEQGTEQGGEQGGEEDPKPATPQQLLDAFVAAVELDTMQYALTVEVTHTMGGEVTTGTSFISCNGRRVYTEYQIGSSAMLRQYGMIDGGHNYMYVDSYAEVYVSYGEEGGLLSAFNALAKEAFLEEAFSVEKPFWNVIKAGMRAEEDGIVFSSEEFTEGSVSIEEGRAVIEVFAASESVGASEGDGTAVRFTVENAGTNEYVPVSEAAEQAFMTVTDFDRAYARFEWGLNANNADISGTLSFASGASPASAQLTATLCDGEMMLSVGEIYEDAVMKTPSGGFCKLHFSAFDMIRPGNPGEKSYEVTAGGVSAAYVRTAFAVLSFTVVGKEYYQLKDGTDNVLTLSEAGREFYNYCESMEIACNEDGTFRISATVDGSSAVMYVESVELTVSDIGEQEEVVFPEDVQKSYDKYFSTSA